MVNTNKNRFWCAMYSQTGSELSEIIKSLGRYPDLIVYNNFKSQDKIPTLPNLHHRKYLITCTISKPTIETYRKLFKPNSLITLHGWLRVIPPEICHQYEIYNGHPGLISRYSELKGKDPQKKAFDLHLPISGCVIHRVAPEVDSGKIIAECATDIQNLTLAETIDRLHNISINLWIDFLRRYL